jgi:hypothetical protein
MDWTQTIALGGTLIAYMTGMCIFLYRLNEKSITEWRNEHSKQMNEWRDEHKTQIQENEAHWREMFTHFNTRLDSMAGNK